MYDFYEEPRKLNMKKVILISAILILILIFLIVFIVKKVSTPKNENIIKNEASTTFYSHDNLVSIELSNSLNLKNYHSSSDYLLELRSENNLNIFVEKKDALPNKTLSEITEADKIAFLDDFDSHSNLSDTKELSVNNNLGYTYSFHYLDKKLNAAFYLQVVWLQIKDSYYIFDIEFPLDDLSFNTSITASVLSSFKINK